MIVSSEIHLMFEAKLTVCRVSHFRRQTDHSSLSNVHLLKFSAFTPEKSNEQTCGSGPYGSASRPLLPILLNELGIVIDSRFLQAPNEPVPRLRRYGGISTYFKPVQPRRTFFPIAESLVGSFMVSSFFRFLKASSGKTHPGSDSLT